MKEEKFTKEDRELIGKRIRKIEKNLTRIYEKILSVDIELRDMRRSDRLKEIEKESKKLNDEKNYLENISDHRYDRTQDEINWFNEE